LSGQRDLRIDTLRGLALVGMTVAHVNLRGIPSAFPRFGYTGVAEVFVLLSGLVAGMIYWRLAERVSPREVWAVGLRRAGFLYLTYLGLAYAIILLTVGVRGLGAEFVPFGGELIVRSPWAAALLVPPFVYQPGYADILPMYCVFVAFTPLAVLMTKRGKLAQCIAGSAVIWLLAQLGLGDAVIELVTDRISTRPPFFDILGWQMVFLGGLVLGMRREAGISPVVPTPPWLMIASVAVVVVCFAMSHGGFGAPDERGGLGWLEDRSSFGPLRVLNAAAYVVVVARLGSYRTPWLEQRWLAMVGAHSLPVFVYSCFLGYAITPFNGTPLALRVAVVILGVASLTIPALVHQRFRAARRAKQAVPGSGEIEQGRLARST
jgi:hypothetical protein